MSGGPWARFDDLRAGRAFAFPVVRRMLVAERAEDVVAVLQEVERATNAGWWAFGYVSYEAAGGLDPSLAVHPPPVDSVPLVWFGLSDEPVPEQSLDSGIAGAGSGDTAAVSGDCAVNRNRNRRPASSRSVSRLRACWVSQAPVGWAVTPSRCTRRVACSMTKNA